ncbi:MAG: hypothetical protein ABI615_04350 [Chthoniobacterales bacterium]
MKRELRYGEFHFSLIDRQAEKLAICRAQVYPAYIGMSENKQTPETWIVDGLGGGHSRWERLRKRLEKDIGPSHIWRYPSGGSVCLHVLGEQLAEQLAKSDGSFHLIGYSMGGLIVREALRVRPELAVKRVITLHTPHGGSNMARFVPRTALKQMRPGSDFLKQLDAAEWPHRTLVTWCPGDLIVVPGSSARWMKAQTIIRSDVPAHAWPVFSPAIHRAILKFLRDDEKSP